MGWSEYLRARPRGLEEGERDDPAGRFATANLEGQRRPRGREVERQIREGDPLSQGGRMASAGRFGHGLPVRANRGAVARDRASFRDLDPDQPTLETLRAFLFERGAPDEHVVEVHEPVLGGLERRVVPVELLSREKVPLLETKGVARP